MNDPIVIEKRDADILYYPGFISAEDGREHFSWLLENTPWQQDDIKVFGKIYQQPRLTAFYADNGKSYSYSNIQMDPLEFNPVLNSIKLSVEDICGMRFSSCLLNLYRNGQDSNGWHADDEKELGINPVIASVSLGAERVFHLKHRKNKAWKHKLILEHGSLLLMKGSTQHNWLHQIPKTKKEVGKRINLTFRSIN